MCWLHYSTEAGFGQTYAKAGIVRLSVGAVSCIIEVDKAHARREQEAPRGNLQTRDAPVYKILFTRTADRTLRKLPADIAQRIRRRLDNIAMDPYAVHLDVTKLQNRPGYRLRVGDWRVIYELENNELIILVLRIGLRGEVYR